MILLPNFARSLKVAEENRELVPQELKLFLVYARHLGFKTSIHNRKRQLQNFLAEVMYSKTCLGDMESPEYIIWLHSSVEIELPKQQSHFPNKSMVVCKIYLKKRQKPCSSSLVKNYHFTFDMYG